MTLAENLTRLNKLGDLDAIYKLLKELHDKGVFDPGELITLPLSNVTKGINDRF